MSLSGQLSANANVVLFETAGELLSLQSTSQRRRLDPHIYEWPAHDTVDPIANLPILDWESGTCRAVRENVLVSFGDISVRIGQRLQRRTRHRVLGLAVPADDYDLRFVDLDDPAPAPGNETTERFNRVLLAVGFGLEPRESVSNIQSASYWSDAGVPVTEFEAGPTPRFLSAGRLTAD